MNIYRILWAFNVLKNKMRSHNNANQMMMTKTPKQKVKLKIITIKADLCVCDHKLPIVK